MPPHVPETCNESDGSWLPLIEYSVKTGVSLSTIRRKIKTNSIQYRLEKGRYLIMHNPASEKMSVMPPPLFSVEAHGAGFAEAKQEAIHEKAPVLSDVDRWQDKPLSRFSPPSPVSFEAVEEEERRVMPMVEKAVNMVSDAFEFALVQKEEQIRMLEQRNSELEERVVELKLLVRVLEDKYKVRY